MKQRPKADGGARPQSGNGAHARRSASNQALRQDAGTGDRARPEQAGVPPYLRPARGVDARAATSQALVVPTVGSDHLEREADRMAETALIGGGSVQDLARRLGLDPASVSLHAGSAAAVSAAALRARAYTVGSDIVFGAGQLAPGSTVGAQLIAHELSHVAQQRRLGVNLLQRQSADMVMPEARITGALNPISTGVKDLSQLTTRVAGSETTVTGFDPDAPDPSERLPFTSGGWEAGMILTRLGQHDAMAGTDSDANRCVQAVALSSYIVEGPEAVRRHLNALLLDAAMSRPRGARENKAREVLEYFQARLENREATYGDLSWAQEALHDLFYADRVGTPEGDIPGLLAHAMGPDRQFEQLDLWCESPEAVVQQAKRLEPGQQLLAVPVTVIFNEALDAAGPAEIRGDGEAADARVDETDVVMEDGRRVHVTRFDASRRPPASAIDRARDRVKGHQILIIRDAVTGEIRVYEPEVTDFGDHFMELDDGGRNFEGAFRDTPSAEVYGYVQIIGRVTPKTLPPRMFQQYRPSWL